MACATLKRSHNFDIMEASYSKRRRYQTLTRNCNTEVATSESPFVPKEFSTQTQLKRRIKEEIKRLQRRRLIPRFLGSPTPAVNTTFISHAKGENVAVASCSGSFRSMVLRSPTSDSQDSDSDQSPLRNSEPIFRPLENTSVVPSHLSLKPTQTIETMPIFTLPQVTALCERLIKEREAELREEYDNILSCKLAEQYEAFLKFNHDQLYSRFQNSPMSYVS
ncbi:Akirin-1 isoform 2 [Schistosoma japonicum]|uniref:Akirin-1 isoform 2 n=1 Tax=Schistosoma japonicum TaxID=6182 RepID=Q5D9W5_SCHJA|nr:SJCHGC06088 protein [Schistosoma japonicum]KAH8867711.1 Akirin-2 [Schistosoma japonicum]TNN18340.1 Akirin-1 isoform 2 [Schistosoma japonicum]CAX72828.1 Transmembrane 9 superfamily protein member 4 [Schistosoma japonicum]CAX72832.1 Transmembrane 9 superfamily protein member 4 [Schistosoma japonicum]